MRKLLALFAALGLVFALGACGGDDDSSSGGNEKGIVQGLVDAGMSQDVAQCIWDKAVEADPSIETADPSKPASDDQKAAMAAATTECIAGDGTGGSGSTEGS